MGKRTKIVIILGLLAGAALMSFRKSIQYEAIAFRVTRQNAPSERAMKSLLAESPTVAQGIVRLWSSGKLPQRHFVMNYLRQNRVVYEQNWQVMEPLVRDAAGSRDLDLQEPSMAILCRQDPATASAAAAYLLTDADPDVRLVGLQSIGQTGDARFVPAMLPALTDREEAVANRAALSLPVITGVSGDLNIRDAASVQAATEKWRRWWQARNEAAGIAVQLPSGSAIIAPDFTLDDTSGKSLRLASLRGKPVLVNFWATWCGPCMQEMPEIVRFYEKHRGQISIVSVCVDAVPDDDGDTPTTGKDPTAAAQAVIARYGMDFPVLLDRTGAAVGSYDASGVPITVLIDSNGVIRRRFLGPRSLDALDRMFAAME